MPDSGRRKVDAGQEGRRLKLARCSWWVRVASGLAEQVEFGDLQMLSRGGSLSEVCEIKRDRGGDGNEWSLRAQSPSHALQVEG